MATAVVALFAAGAPAAPSNCAEDSEVDSPSVYVARRLPEALPDPAESIDSLDEEALTLEEAETLALQRHPGLAEAAARVRAARCHYLQVGLPPNPMIGYSASEVGDLGGSGQQGMIAGQSIVRGNKLGLNRAVAAREVERLQQVLAAERRRVLTDVRTAFFEAYLAQRRVEMTQNLLDVSRQFTTSALALLEAKEGRRTDLLQAEIEVQRAIADLARADAELRGAWRRLGASMGTPLLPPTALAADVESLQWQLTWRQSMERLLRESPEIAEAMAAIEKARWTVARERAEPIPDIKTQLTVQHGDISTDTIVGVQVTLPIPLWNRNQGGICRAEAEVTAARRRLDAVELDLQRRLAAEYQTYESALARVETLRREILPRAQQNLDLVSNGYRAGELGFLDFLTVQRTYFQVNIEYLAALTDLNASVQMLNGLLLKGGLVQ